MLSAGYGAADVERGVAATARSVYDVASVTKMFTAVAVMKLIESGQLRLAGELATLLPAFPNRQQAGQITVQHLLSHTSGLPDYEEEDTERWLAHHTPLTTEFVFDFVRDRRLDFAPGSAFSYSNTGYFLLGLIIERVTGMSFGAVLKEEVAASLGLLDTQLCELAQRTGRTVRGYELDGAAFVPGRLYALGNLIGDGGLCSTVTDLVQLPAKLLHGEVLSPAVVAQMTTPTEIAGGARVDYGLGVRLGVLAGHRLWGHTGGMGTYWSTLAHYPDDDVTLVVLVNTDGAADDALTIEGELARVVLDLADPALQDLPLSPQEAVLFSGSFEDGSGCVRILEKDGHLERMLEGGASRRLKYQGGATFGWRAYPMDRFVFHLRNGRVVGLSDYFNGVFAAYRRAVDPC